MVEAGGIELPAVSHAKQWFQEIAHITYPQSYPHKMSAGVQVGQRGIGVGACAVMRSVCALSA